MITSKNVITIPKEQHVVVPMAGRGVEVKTARVHAEILLFPRLRFMCVRSPAIFAVELYIYIYI